VGHEYLRKKNYHMKMCTVKVARYVM